MQPLGSEWKSCAELKTLLLRYGYDHAGMQVVLSNAIASCSVRVRIGGVVCPAEKAPDLAVNIDAGLFYGWSLHPQTLHLSDDGATMRIWNEADPGLPGEINALDLQRYLKDLRQLEAPEQPRRSNLGGRPGSWAWGRAMVMVGADALANGVPDTSDRFVKIMRDWFVNQTDGLAPDDRQLREYANLAFNTFKQALEV